MQMTTIAVAPGVKKPHYVYMDFLRVLACFLVIVNHTNSYVFQSADPNGLTWYLSMAYHCFCRMAVPIFLIISGANLMARSDGYRVTFRRVMRIVWLLLFFSCFVYFMNAPWATGVWPVFAQIPGFLLSLWWQPASGTYWYLYEYLGLLLMLPFLQKMVAGMKRKRDYHVFFAIWLFFEGVILLASHYVPNAQPSGYFSVPLFSDFIGLMLVGDYVHHHMTIQRKTIWIAAITLLLCIVIPVILTRIEYDVQKGAIEYLFLDWRIKPSIFMMVGAACTVYLARALFEIRPVFHSSKLLQELGACSLFVYMVHNYPLIWTKNSVYLPLADHITALPAVVIWELLIFSISMLLGMVARRLPVLRKFL